MILKLYTSVCHLRLRLADSGNHWMDKPIFVQVHDGWQLLSCLLQIKQQINSDSISDLFHKASELSVGLDDGYPLSKDEFNQSYLETVERRYEAYHDTKYDNEIHVTDENETSDENSGPESLEYQKRSTLSSGDKINISSHLKTKDWLQPVAHCILEYLLDFKELNVITVNYYKCKRNEKDEFHKNDQSSNANEVELSYWEILRELDVIDSMESINHHGEPCNDLNILLVDPLVYFNFNNEQFQTEQDDEAGVTLLTSNDLSHELRLISCLNNLSYAAKIEFKSSCKY
ncbi:hypothetical protein ROZALSC1DRAFT_28247 [Rozella allomycis CSF55]|uniref:Uncharacterized protein n=1 Tax=Rozella allomycis (strain CSF55) TaxID=988480 RepID=A0A4P9YL82_ROZAC|nr:hypothetical protein ROZALSC1DRAFT_28247 [Rozella allomycis CSF55]